MSTGVLRLPLGVVLLAASMLAQTGAGRIQGTVTDATGAILPKASVNLRHIQTDNQFQSVSSDVGFYLFPSLQPGDYLVSVTVPGLQKWEGKTVLRVGQQAEINPVLQVSQTAEQVTVVADVTPLLTTTSPTVATIVERARIEQLPLNGRSIQTLLQITVPGLEGNASQPKVYGLRDSAMEITQDGVAIQDRNTGAIQSRPPGLDSVQEFRVETAVSSARLDRPSSVVMSTRSGTNEIHGSLFLTGRNSGFGVARQRQETFDKPPHLVRNEFGASVGGPVVIPKLYNGRNRTFFFGAWEEFRLRQANTTASRVWTQEMRNGDFSGLIDSAGRRITLYDPWSVGPGPTYLKTPFPNNQIPISKMSPLAKYVYSVTPLPTSPGVNPLVADNYFGPAPNNQDTRTFTFRGDHRISDSDTIFGRFSRGYNDQILRRGFNTAGNPITSDNLWNRETYYEFSNTTMASWTHIFSPTFFVETTGTASMIDWQYSMNQPSAQQNISAMLGTPNPFDVNGAPVLTNLGFNAITYAGVLPRSQYTQIVSIEQNYSKLLSKHQLEFGFRYRNEKLDTIPDRPNQSTLSFDSFATALYQTSTNQQFGATPQTGENAANFFLGVAGSYQQSRPPGPFNMRGLDQSAYIQDNWKLKPNLTVNIGLRWSYLGPYVDNNGMTAGWHFPSKTLVQTASIDQMIQSGYTTKPIADGYANLGVKWTTPNAVGLPDSLVTTSRRNLAPRVGMAYNGNAFGKSYVIRGGYGVYYFPIPARTFSEMRLNPPLQGSYSYSWNNSAQTEDALPNYFMRNAPSVIAGVNSQNVLNINEPPTVLPGLNITGMANEQPTSKAHEWNVTWETEFMKDTVFRVAYIGTAGRNLEMMQLFNRNPVNNYVWFETTRQPVPQGFYQNTARRTYDQTTYGDIRLYSKIGYSNYSGAQVEVERRFSRGLAFQVFYLMSNSTSTGATPSQGGDFTVNAIDQPDRFLAGSLPENLDDRIRFFRYARDTDIPKHRARWNFLYDLPIGRGKALLGGAGGKMNRIVGGWQIAGSGTSNSRYWSLPTANWGTLSNPEIYGTKYKVQDCRSGQCFEGYLYYNGYIPANRRNVPNGVMGLPDNYQPAHQPITPIPANGGSSADPNFAQYETNNVFVPLANGQNQLVAKDTGVHPWRNQAMPGPWLHNATASLFKSIPITERVVLRVNLDAFNVFNNPGMVNVDATSGIISLRNSGQGARTLQYTARITW